MISVSTMTTPLRSPYLMGLIATRSTDTPVTGIKDLKQENRERIVRGMHAYELLSKLKSKQFTGAELQALKVQFQTAKVDLGYGLLLKKYTDKVIDATPAQIDAATCMTLFLKSRHCSLAFV